MSIYNPNLKNAPSQLKWLNKGHPQSKYINKMIK